MQVKIMYSVCALGYDSDYRITDNFKDFGYFDNYEEAYELFVKIQCADPNKTFADVPYSSKWMLQLEECEDYGDVIDCIDVHNEHWFEMEAQEYDN